MKTSRTRLVQSLRHLFIIGLLALTAVILTVQIVLRYQEHGRRVTAMRQEYVQQQRNMIRREVDRVVERVQFKRSTIEARAREQARVRVQEGLAIAAHLLDTYSPSENRETIEGMIVEALRAIRFQQGNGYFFIHDQEGRVRLAAARPELEGRLSSEIHDPQEQEVIRGMIELTRSRGGGFYEYRWPKPDRGQEPRAKTAYVELFEPLGWNIGTGVYSEDLEERIRQDVLAQVSRIRYGDNGYFFIDDWDGLVLTHGAQPDLIGTNIWEHEDGHGLKVVQKLIEAARTEKGDFVEYSWIKPDTGEERPKVSFARGIHEWEWMIGTGVYVDDVEKDIARLRDAMNRSIIQQILLSVLLMGVIIALSYGALNRISRRVNSELSHISEFFRRAAREDVRIDEELVRYQELNDLAGEANRMLADKQAAQDAAMAEKERLAVILQSIGDGVVVTDIFGKVQLINEVGRELVGFASDPGLGRPLDEVLPLVDPEEGQAISLGPPGDQAEALTVGGVALLDRGQPRPVLDFTRSPLRDRSGQVAGTVVVFRDITEQIRAEKQQERLRKLESVGQLAGGIAHDFNNLLTVLIGNLDMARMSLDSNPGEAENFLASAEKSLRQATTLTRQLLTFAKGGDPLLENVCLGDTLVETARFACRGSAVDLTCDIASDLWPVAADRGQVSQVMTNLILNAKQAMPRGGRLEVKAGNLVVDGERRLVITVRDDGEGIPPENLERIFEPYFTTKSSGSGLGLASCHSIIRKHGGRISVLSKPGEGTTFTIMLPALMESEEVAIEHRDQRPETELDLAGQRVLVLDDEEAIRELLVAMLERLGCEVVWSEDSESAIRLFTEARQKEPFDFMITDLTLPGHVGGEVVAARILDVDPDFPIIVSSGYSTGSVMAHYREHGFMGRLTKPYHFEELIGVLRRALVLDRQTPS